jgi:hypothetical protein
MDDPEPGGPSLHLHIYAVASFASPARVYVRLDEILPAR